MKKLPPLFIICKICKKRFKCPDNVKGKARKNRRFCSMKCLLVQMKKEKRGFQKGHGAFKGTEQTQFKKGLTPWNKGIHRQFNNALMDYKKKYGSAFKGRKHTEETKEKLRQLMIGQKRPSGKNHWNWKGGTSKLRDSIMALQAYKKWRTAVYARDDYTCLICKKRGGTLNANHIKSFSQILHENKIRTVKQAKKCLELWDVSNGQTHCITCHQKTDTFGSKSIIS